MKITTEKIEQILDGAPEGFTVYRNNRLYKKEPRGWLSVRLDGTGKTNKLMPNSSNIHHLSDLREILTLRQEVERVNSEAIKLLDAAVCPCCDKSGVYYGNHGEVYQCQWCDEVNELREQGDE